MAGEPTSIGVTVLSSLPPQRGITPYTLELLGALAAYPGVTPEALGFSRLYPRRMYPGGEPDGGDDARVPVPERRVLRWYDPLSWVCAGFGVRGDVLHAQWWSWFLAPAYLTVIAVAKARGKRVVVTVHNAKPHERAWWKRALNRAVIAQAQALIVHSEQNRTVLAAQGVPAGRISVVPIGVQRLQAAVPPRDEARAALKKQQTANSKQPGRFAAQQTANSKQQREERDRERIVLFLGNIRPYKGVDVLVRAAALLRERVPGLRVIIAGERWRDAPDARALAARLAVGDVVEVREGFVPDGEAALLLGAADVVAMPYVHFDGQSAAAALALTAGRAVIVSDEGGLPDLVRDRRAVVPSGDERALADALAAVLLDDALRESLEADAAAVCAELGWEAIAAATADVYRRALGLVPAAEISVQEERAA